MGEFSPIHKIIDSAIALDLGNPNFAISDKERLLKDAAVTLGCMDYYRVFPMPSLYLTTYNSYGDSGGTFDWAGISPAYKDGKSTYVPFDTLLTQGTPAVPEEQLPHAHFLGIIRIERPYWSTWSNPSTWQRQLFGIQIDSNQFDISKTLLSNTLDDLSTGQPQYMINRMQKRLEILPSWGFGQLSIISGIGFDTPEYVEMSKADLLCKFISYRFIESIIQARSGVQLTADFTLSTQALEKRLEKLKEEIDSIKNHTPLHFTQWS